MRYKVLTIAFAGILGMSTSTAQEGASQFDSAVRPVLRAKCIACHSDKNTSSGLSLESGESIRRGGNRGPSVVPGDPAASTLIQAVRQSGTLKMPPGGKLSDAEIAVIESWVKDGATVPKSSAKAPRPGADHWSYKPPVRRELPAVRDMAWVRNPIDRFVLARLDAASLKPSPEADAATLLRRVSLDLAGLPPTPAELAEFLKDKRPDAYERVVDRLLASKHYGERWGRHWLDVARYADSDGYTIDAPRDIWKYRDWVIDAVNRDVPFDRFVIEQIAGDLLPNRTQEQLIATGFHRNTPSNYEGGIDFEQYRVEAVVDRVSTTGAAFLGLTLGCARCHDHKFDPVSQREFYQLLAFFNNIDEVDKEAERKYFNKPFLELGTAEEIAAHADWEQKVVNLETEMRKHLESISGDPDKDATAIKMRKDLAELRKQKPKLVRTMIMRELPTPRQAYIHLGGDFTRHGANVEPGVLSILPPLDPPTDKPNRLDLARWLMDKRNPLTARVTVNRYWQKYFGRGIVETENDFGTQGDKPSHPELLDWLALEFQSDWSQKRLHRLIVTSATYRQASTHRPDAAAVDPDNRLIARQGRVRLDAEIIRDASLVASGLFADEVGGPSVYPPIPPGANSVTQVKREWITSTGAERYRRGMYTFFQRSAGHPSLIVFDAPDATVTCTRRVRSNTPLQALTMLNDEASIEFAEALATRLIKEVPSDENQRIRRGYVLALNREPRADERERLVRFLRQQRDSNKTEQATWTAISRVLLNVDEFLTRE